MCRARLTLAAARFPIPATMPLNPPPRNLRDLLRAEPRLDPSRVQRILAELSGVLAPRHARGQAHGAITPEYVRFDAAGRAILAAPPDDDRSPAPWPAYLSPEQVDGRAADPRSDVYALGLLGWEMLAGQAPWAGESLYSVVLKQREQDLPRLSTLRPGLPRGLVRAIEGALHKHPGDRWQGAPEVLAQLRDDGALPASESAAGVATATTAAAGVTAEVPVFELPRVEPPVAPRRVVAPEASPTVPVRPVVPPARAVADAPEPVARPSRLRPLGLVALAIAVLGAAAAGVAVMQGRQESTTTKAWLDSVAGGASGEVVAESTLTAPVRRAQAEARRDSLQRRARLLAAARRDSVRRADSAARAVADSAAVAAAPADSTTPPDTIAPPPPDTVLRTASRSASGEGACAASDAGSQRRCLVALLERGDAPLNRAYAARIAELRRAAGTAPGAPDPPTVETLRAEQRAWLAQRDTECRRRGEGREGALWAPERARCLVALGQQRASALDS
jgi:serine/threonine-protein kinase